MFPVIPCCEDGNCSCPPRHPSRRQVDGTYGSCGSPGKHPLTGDGHKSADTDIAKIEEWFTKGEYNVAIRTGTNGQGILVVIDIDQGNGKPGAKTLKDTRRQVRRTAGYIDRATGCGLGVTMSTGRQTGPRSKAGRTFCVWKLACRIAMGTARRRKAESTFAAEGGYIVAAPSKPREGQVLVGELGRDIAELPAWLLKAPRRPGAPGPASDRACARFAGH